MKKPKNKKGHDWGRRRKFIVDREKGYWDPMSGHIVEYIVKDVWMYHRCRNKCGVIIYHLNRVEKQWQLGEECNALYDKKGSYTDEDIQKYKCGNLIIKSVLE